MSRTCSSCSHYRKFDAPALDPTPNPGQHSCEALEQWGLGAADVEALLAKGAVRAG